jgi:hypothetical protein
VRRRRRRRMIVMIVVMMLMMMMMLNSQLARDRLRLATALRDRGASTLPTVHQTWKTHHLDPVMRGWYMSWLRNGFSVQLRNDTECLADMERLSAATGRPEFVSAYHLLTPVQRADFWRYAITYMEGGIYSDIDISATPDTAQFFLDLDYSRVDLVGVIENDPYDNYLGRFHWKVGMSPMYSRIPQLRQSFFFASAKHPHLLDLLGRVAAKAETWHKSGHKDLGDPRLSPDDVQEMERTGALTLEMTGPGVWTDHMLTPLPPEERSGKKRDGRSVILSTMEGYALVRYASMGSWKTSEHKADQVMWRRMIGFYSTPVVFFILYRTYAKYARNKRPKIA